MNSRRKFILGSSVATTALLASKPMSAIANVASPLNNLLDQQQQLVLLHTATLSENNQQHIAEHISGRRKKAWNTIAVNAGKETVETTGSTFDTTAASLAAENNSLFAPGYKLIRKNGIKTAVISVKTGDNDIINNVNKLAAHLKNEKGCNMVVCLSQLGYKNNGGPDDITLAEKSTHIDVIIGGHASNFAKRPMTARNKNKAEVILHSAAGRKSPVGEIRIGFDNAGNKNSVGFTDPFTASTTRTA